MTPVRFGIIGSGGYARYHIELLTEIEGVSIVGLMNPRPGQIQETKAEFPNLATCPEHTTTESLLADPSVDAVLIASPHTLHTRQILDSFAAGKHVLIEKPLTCTVKDTLEVITARDKSGRVGAIAYQRHGMGHFKDVRRIIASGQFGRILGLNSHLARPWLQLAGGTWRHKLELSGGGQINDGGSHLIDVLLWTTGLRAKRVSAMMDNRGTEVDIDSIVSIEFEGGAYGSLTIIGDSSAWHERHQVWLEKGALLFGKDDLTIIDELGRVTKVSNWPDRVTPDQDFVDAIRNGTDVMAPFECGLHTIELTEAAWKSAAQGGVPVEVASL